MEKLIIRPEPGQKIWFTSDLHLMHRNISGPSRSKWKSGYRDFADEYVMTDHIIDSINAVVKMDDILFNLGDFLFRNPKGLPTFRDRIYCRHIHHILGNHDQHMLENPDIFTSQHDLLELALGNLQFVLCHYALRTWPHSHKGSYHLYGHSHDNLDKHPQLPWGRSMDVGIDSAKRILGEYRPFSHMEVHKILQKRSAEPVARRTEVLSV